MTDPNHENPVRFCTVETAPFALLAMVGPLLADQGNVLAPARAHENAERHEGDGDEYVFHVDFLSV